MPTDTHREIDAIWWIESPKIIGALTRIVRDVGIAEDLAQDALVVALEQWPQSGIPDNPGAWLMGTAKHRAIDFFRRTEMADRKHADLGRDYEDRERTMPDFDSHLDDPIGDDLLRLIFIACHPVVPREARIALTLKLLGGLSTIEIARAFVLTEPTIAQRIVRAKRTLSEKQVPFEIPRGSEMNERLTSVLEVIYLIFNEGYTATAGDDWMRPRLCDEALRLGRILAELAPQQPEVHGLVALMEIQSSRSKARNGPNGEPILLMDQNRARWDQLLIQRGFHALEKALKPGGSQGPYTLQAEIAACHARAREPRETDWQRIVELYGDLAEITPSPIVELNRAVAVSMASGPEQALHLLDQLATDPRLQNYHLLPSARGDFLKKLGRLVEARAEFERAASMTRNARERELLLGRARECTQ